MRNDLNVKGVIRIRWGWERIREKSLWNIYSGWLVGLIFPILGITLTGRYATWLAVARPRFRQAPSSLPPSGRHHFAALMRDTAMYVSMDVIGEEC